MKVSLTTVVLVAASTCHSFGQATDPWVTYEGVDGPGDGKHIVLISGDEEYRSEEALPQLGKILATQHGFTCTVLFSINPETGEIDPENRQHLPGLKHLEDADLMVIATRFRNLPNGDMALIDAYLRAGKPVIGIRTATHGFNLDSDSEYIQYTWNSTTPGFEQGFGRQILGETWIAHHGAHGRESTRGVIAESARTHPIARGIEPGSIWGPTDVYRVRLPLPDGSEPIVLGQVLAGMTQDAEPVVGEKNEPMMPIGWTRTYQLEGGEPGRVFTSTLGAATDFVAEGSRRMIVNAVYWALGMDDDIPVDGTRVDLVGLYEPSDFGFGAHRRGMKPQDHAIDPDRAPEPQLSRDDVTGVFEVGRDDHVVIIGNSFAERMALSGYFDALAHAAHPEHELVIRHIPWSADEVATRPREMKVPTTEDLLAAYEADVIFMCFGMSESFGGEQGLATFERTLDDQIRRFLGARYNGESAPRLVLVSPILHEDLGPPFLTGPELANRNETIRAYGEAMRRAAEQHGLRFIDLFKGDHNSGGRLTSNGIHPNERGCRHFARAMGQSLGWLEPGEPESDAGDVAAAKRVREIAYSKHWHHRLLYRPTNTEYVFGRRHEPFGVVNFPPEMDQLRRMIAVREREMWSIDVPPAAVFASEPTGAAIWERVPSSNEFAEDSWTPPPVEAKGTETSLGSLEILDPDAFADSFTLPAGYEINCFASEQDFAELQSPLAMTFDAHGRLWVLCTPTYPHLMPGETPRCRILILEDTNGDGRADTSTIFSDELYIPTGFAVDTDAVYLGQAPDLWKLTDVDGDDRVDRREIVLSGFGMPDSHHQVSAFEWDPAGAFVFAEGVFTKSNIETPHGTYRTRDAAIWRFDPRTGRLQIMSHCGYANPWGHVFDDWGQSIVADASGGDNFSFSHVITNFQFPRKPARNKLLNRGRPTAGCELILGRHFPDEVQGSYVVNQSIGFHGTRWDRIIPDGSAWKPESMPQDLLASSDTNFRPVAMEMGPDGALYICDWCNPIIGHMQYSVRDPRRDHSHGRIWRITHSSRPLVNPPQILGAPTPELLELLRLPEANTRQHVRRALHKKPASEVFPELVRWLAQLDDADELHDRLHLEALWLHQAHGRIDLGLLDRVASLGDPRARAGAVRVLRHWLQLGSVDRAEALPLLQRAVEDSDMQVRLEGVVACGFVEDVSGAAVAALASALPMDEPMRTALQETLTYLEQYGEPRSEIVRRLRLERAPAAELADEAMDALVAGVVIVRPDVDRETRAQAIEFLAAHTAVDQVTVLVTSVLDAHREEEAVEAAAPFMRDAPSDELAAAIDALERAASHETESIRCLGLAGLVIADRANHSRVGSARDAVRVLSFLPQGEAPGELIETLRAAVERGRVEPRSAIEQITRHSAEGSGLKDWLTSLADAAADRSLESFGARHQIAMAALRALNSGNGPGAYSLPRAPDDQFELGRRIYHDEITGCVRCHGEDGRGEEGFPPLDNSPWALGHPERAAAIVVHGLYGEIVLHDGRRFDSVMEPLGSKLTDEEIAAVLTFVRQSWGNYASAVDLGQAAAARAIKPEDGSPLFAQDVVQRYPLSDDVILTVRRDAIEVDEPPNRLTVYLLIGVVVATVILLVIGAIKRKGVKP